jgi:uncharacterized protein (TIGR02145 family)
MFNKKIIISIVVFIFLIIGITAFQYFKNDDAIGLPPNEKFFPVIEDFECGDPVTFNYSGEIVTYGTVENPETGKCWMDRNLGALRVAEAFNDPKAYGDLYQWGRINDGHEKRNSEKITARSDTDNPGHNKFIGNSDWRETPNDQLWQGENGINNPCPKGWRLPTANQWKEEMETWISKDRQGAYNSPLKLTAGGLRYNISAEIVWEDRFGEYWSSSVGPNDTSLWLQFLDHEADIVTNLRGFGLSIRCVRAKEEKFVEESDNEEQEKSKKPYIKIISPNGGETLFFREKNEIIWESEGVDKIKDIVLIDYLEGVECGRINLNVPADIGKYKWYLLPINCYSGHKFKIRICSSNEKVIAESDDYFTVTTGSLGVSDLYIKNLSGFGCSVETIFETKKIEDINQDGYNEILTTASGSSGSCVGGTDYKILYSPKDQEYFIAAKSRLSSLPYEYEETAFCPIVKPFFWEGCGETLEYVCFSNNLKEDKNKSFYLYLEKIFEI